MNIFDNYILAIQNALSLAEISRLDFSKIKWELTEKNTFLMERDTAIELGGYPKESVNIIVPSSDMYSLINFDDGIYCIGDPSLLSKKAVEKHISFGKIVFLETNGLAEKDYYDFTQSELLTDSRVRMKDVMLRQSPVNYNTNLRISKKAVKNGFDAKIMGTVIYDAFHALENVSHVTVLLIFGDSPLYRQLFEIAENIKEATLTINHIFDGITMDCGRCDVKEICNEIEGMRELHQKMTRSQQRG